jgi:predicted secreted protein
LIEFTIPWNIKFILLPLSSRRMSKVTHETHASNDIEPQSGDYRVGVAQTGPRGDTEKGRDATGFITSAPWSLKILRGDAEDVEDEQICGIAPRDVIDVVLGGVAEDVEVE